MTAHSPLPWTWHPKSDDQEHNGSVYRLERPGHAYAIAMQPRYVDDEQWKADAALIVRSVNLLPEALAALEEIRKIADETPASEGQLDIIEGIAAALIWKARQP